MPYFYLFKNPLIENLLRFSFVFGFIFNFFKHVPFTLKLNRNMFCICSLSAPKKIRTVTFKPRYLPSRDFGVPLHPYRVGCVAQFCSGKTGACKAEQNLEINS